MIDIDCNHCNVTFSTEIILAGGLAGIKSHISQIDKRLQELAKVKSRNEAGKPGDRQPEPKACGNTQVRGNA